MLLGLLPHSACASSADFDCYFLVQYSYILLFIAKNSHTFKYFYGVVFKESSRVFEDSDWKENEATKSGTWTKAQKSHF